MEVKILYEDEHLMVVDKPVGMVVNRAQSVAGQTVQDWAEEKIGIKGDEDEVFVKRSGIAHRLDKETSGCLVIAKTPEALEGMLRAFKERTVSKEYVAMVHGQLEPDEGTIRLPIGRDRVNRKRRKVMVEGKVAQTRWKVEKRCEKFCLVHLFPTTGRTHQIRVHMQFLGHPLVGDKLYGNRKQVRREQAGTGRHFLHAAGVEFRHPITGEMVRVKSKLPEDLLTIEANIC